MNTNDYHRMRKKRRAYTSANVYLGIMLNAALGYCTGYDLMFTPIGVIVGFIYTRKTFKGHLERKLNYHKKQ